MFESEIVISIRQQQHWQRLKQLITKNTKRRIAPPELAKAKSAGNVLVVNWQPIKRFYESF